MSDDIKPELTEAEQKLLQLNVLKGTAVRQAMCEVIAERRDEILTRARAKLTAMGVSVQMDEIEPTL